MNTKLTLIVLAFTLVLFSCKKETKSNLEVEVENSEVSNPVIVNFTFTLSAKVLSNETFRVYYGYSEEPFSEERAIYLQVEGSPEIQNLVFNFPDKEAPERLRIHIGPNNINQEIQLGDMVFNYGESELVIDNTNFSEYFNNSDYFIYDISKHSLKSQKINNVYDPHLVSNENLRHQLIKMQQN